MHVHTHRISLLINLSRDSSNRLEDLLPCPPLSSEEGICSPCLVGLLFIYYRISNYQELWTLKAYIIYYCCS